MNPQHDTRTTPGRRMILVLAALALLAAGGVGLYRTGLQRGMDMHAPAAPGAAATTPAADRKVLYWHDPMVPGQRFDKPGKSPFMDMQLVPVYADAQTGAGADDGGVRIDPRMQQNLGMRTAVVTRSALQAPVEAVGSVAYNERDVAVVQARSNGFVERLYVRAVLDPVRKGQALAELYVPEWIAAQEEYLSIKRMSGAGTDGLLDAARQRMRLVGMSDEQIAAVAASGKTRVRFTIAAPQAGVITELGAREGMTVMAGAPLFRINGLASVWVNAEVPENLAAQVRPGSTVEARTPALPGTVFKGRVAAILPEVSGATRTLKARIELANPSGQLVPGMFATVRLSGAAAREALFVPSEAVIQTGTRAVVMVAQGDGRFIPAEVEVGSEANGQSEIRKGLEAGQKVVVSGQFLIDSEASLRATGTRMSAPPATQSTVEPIPQPTAQPTAQPPSKPTTGAAQKAPTDATLHRGQGKIEKIDRDELMLSHGPIASLQWGPMTMGFKLPAAGLPKNFVVGDSVAFEFKQTAAGHFQIVGIKPLAQPEPER